jgi:hypothetical protein
MRGLKTGDIFEVSVEDTRQFIQYVVTDKSCLSGQVVRVSNRTGLPACINERLW